MDLTIRELPAKTFQELTTLAESEGKSPEDYARDLIETALMAKKPFREIFAPVREHFQKSGMTGDELDDLVEQLRDKIHHEKQQNGK